MRTPTCFVSYSWDDEDHKSWVKDLAARLRADGVDVTLDCWHAVPGDQLPVFMERAIRENDFVLIVCTPGYKVRADNRRGGVGYEGDIITGEIFTGAAQRKIIPIKKSGSWEEAAPSFCLGRYYIDFSSDVSRANAYLQLLRVLTGTLEQAPPVGRIPENLVGEYSSQKQALARGRKWAKFEFYKFPIPPFGENDAGYSLILEAIEDAARTALGDRAEAFAFGLRRVELTDERTGIPINCWMLGSHRRAFVRKAGELYGDRLRQLLLLKRSDEDKETKQRKWLALGDQWKTERAGWRFNQDFQLPGDLWQACTLTYEPQSRYIEVVSCPIETDPAAYQEKVKTTSEAIAYACSLLSGGVQLMGDLVWIGTYRNYPLTKLVVRKLDTQIVDFGDFRCDLDDPEVWDYLYPSFDTEVENGERARDGAPKRKS